MTWVQDQQMMGVESEDEKPNLEYQVVLENVFFSLRNATCKLHEDTDSVLVTAHIDNLLNNKPPMSCTEELNELSSQHVSKEVENEKLNL